MAKCIMYYITNINLIAILNGYITQHLPLFDLYSCLITSFIASFWGSTFSFSFSNGSCASPLLEKFVLLRAASLSEAACAYLSSARRLSLFCEVLFISLFKIFLENKIY